MITYEPRLPKVSDPNFVLQLTSVLRDLGTRLDTLSKGSLSGVRGKGTAAPTTGTWAKGDVIRNTTPSESGAGGSKYVIYGWECVTGGTPGTWKDMRMLTGN